MYHLKISIPSFRQILPPTTRTDNEPNQAALANRGHYVYSIEVGFLGEYGQGLERQERMARFYHLEKRYSAFLTLHNEVNSRLSSYWLNKQCHDI